MTRKDPHRAEAERARGRQLRDLTVEAVDLAMTLAPEVAAAPSPAASERAVDLPFETADDATFARKRINEALAAAEWSSEVTAWVWKRDKHQRAPLTDAGAQRGFELRLEQPHRAD